MRPLASNNLPIEGMLLLTLTSRRCAQKPFSMVTACTGTLRSLAYGDFVRLRMPWSRHGGVLTRATDDCAEFSSAPTLAAVKLARSSRLDGKQEIAAAEIAEETNCRGETPRVLLRVVGLPAGRFLNR